MQQRYTIGFHFSNHSLVLLQYFKAALCNFQISRVNVIGKQTTEQVIRVFRLGYFCKFPFFIWSLMAAEIWLGISLDSLFLPYKSLPLRIHILVHHIDELQQLHIIQHSD